MSVFWTTLPLAGCLVPRHDDFTTPQDTVLTFQSAFARDDEFQEYDCLAREMKEATDPPLTQQIWSTARATIFEPLGAIGRFVLRRNTLEDNLLGGTLAPGRARLVYSIVGNALEVEVASEAVFTLPDPRTQGKVAFPLARDSACVAAAEDGAATFVVVIEAADELAARWLAEGVAWAELGERWKIAGVRTLEEPPADVAALPPREPVPLQWHKVAAIRPRKLRASLGAVRLRFELPLPLGAGGAAHRRSVAVAPAAAEG